jgi:hypothetical protein
MGQMGDGDELERAFAGATVHDVSDFTGCIINIVLQHIL